VGGARTDGACGDDAEDSDEDERNEGDNRGLTGRGRQEGG